MSRKAELFGEVRSVTPLSATMIRVVLGGGTLSDFSPSTATDAYVNARFIPARSPLTVPFGPADVDALAPDDRPRPRRFTVRRWDGIAQELTIDFVVHGDEGFAGSWAQRATPGDRLQFAGPGGNHRPDPGADWHLLVGDESALPAVAASLEAMPAGAVARVFLVVDGPASEFDLRADTGLGERPDSDVIITWLHRQEQSEPERVLVDAVASADLPAGSPDVFVHGEAGEVREVRRHLIADRGIDPSSASISPYWRRSLDDESWRRVKRDWVASQASDV